MTVRVFPAHGWLPIGTHFELKWDDQGRDFATGWMGGVQAPGNGRCIAILHDRPFPDGFGPGYPVVRIDSGPWAGHEYYLGHTSARVREGERFSFGRILSIADQGHDWAGTVGGWVELGEAFGGLPGPKRSHHWFDSLIATPMVLHLPERSLVFGEHGVRVYELSLRLRDCGYLRRPSWRFGPKVNDALRRFKRHHNLPVNQGVVDERTEVALAHAAQVCRRTRRTEV